MSKNQISKNQKISIQRLKGVCRYHKQNEVHFVKK